MELEGGGEAGGPGADDDDLAVAPSPGSFGPTRSPAGAPDSFVGVSVVVVGVVVMNLLGSVVWIAVVPSPNGLHDAQLIRPAVSLR